MVHYHQAQDKGKLMQDAIRTTRFQRACAVVATLGCSFFILYKFVYFQFLGPRIQLEQHYIDFGEIPNGVRRVYSIQARNSGARELVIQKVVPSCGCVDIEISPSNRVPPGSSVRMDVGIELIEKIKSKSVDLFVFSNDRMGHIPRIVVQARSSDGESEIPRVIDFGRIGRNQIPVTRKQSFSVGRSGFAPSTNDLHGNLISIGKSAKFEGMYEIRLEVKDDTPSGAFYEEVPLLARSSALRQKIVVRGYVAGGFTAAPSVVVIGPVYTDDANFSERIKLFNTNQYDDRESTDVHVITCELSPQVDSVIECVPIDSSGNPALDLLVNPSRVAGPISSRTLIGSATCTLKNSDGHSEHLSIPILVRLAAHSHKR